MVIIFLNSLQFEAQKFETRTMPTPNMKGKEVIYWIKVSTEDKRLASDIQRFLEGAPKFIDLKVPSAFITAKTELESFRVLPPKDLSQVSSAARDEDLETVSSGSLDKNQAGNEKNASLQARLEILLRRTLPETPEKQPQSPYG